MTALSATTTALSSTTRALSGTLAALNATTAPGAKRVLSTLLLLLLALPVAAAPEFPELTGRVVDNAELLSEAQERALSEQLASAEQSTSNQIVVVTLADLQGYDLADYGYQLGREWGIGQEGRDNGVLLLVAPAEREVRIEVGYGLEGALTDATSASIIQNEILPAFRQGDFAAGIQQGVTSILSAVEGEYQATAGAQRSAQAGPSGGQALVYLIVLIVMTLFMTIGGLGRRRGRSGLMFLPMGMMMGGMGGGGGGGFGGGGFGGGGGGFGGGGASGGW